MRRPAGALATVAALAVAGCGGSASAPQRPVNTATVQQGPLSAIVSQAGTLTYRARAGGEPYVAINQARGIYTQLPDVGDRIGCGDVLYRVDDHPVILLCGAVPAYRRLEVGRTGPDVRQLSRNLHALGYHADPGASAFSASTQQALRRFQRDRRLPATGTLALDEAVFLPKPARIAKVTAALGAFARPGAPVAQATSDTLEVQANLDPAQQDEVKVGDRVQITLPDNATVKGRVDHLGGVAQAAGKDGAAGQATIPVSVGLDDRRQVGGLDQAPVQVDITTKGAPSALSVPVTALVGRAGGGFAVEVVRGGGQRELVAVRLGLFDTASGRVEVDGALRAGDRVVVPSL